MVRLTRPTSFVLDARRRGLGMTCRVLALRSGVSEPTVKRVLSGKGPDASHGHVAAIAGAMGMMVQFEGEDASAFKAAAARRKAEWLVRQVQGSSGLEAQGVDEGTVRAMVEQTFHELMAGSARRIWEE